jgi:hypothetical protein
MSNEIGDENKMYVNCRLPAFSCQHFCYGCQSVITHLLRRLLPPFPLLKFPQKRQAIKARAHPSFVKEKTKFYAQFSRICQRSCM